MFFIILILILIIIFILFTHIYAGIITAPFVFTPKNYIRKALEICQLKKGEKIYDLGSGDGRVLIIAAKEFNAEAVGFELSYFLYFISKINIFLHRLSKRAKVRWSNFYEEDLSLADVIFCWLTPKAFPKLANKFNQELKIGTRIITYSSPLGFWQPEREVEFQSEGIKIFGKTLIKPTKVKIFFYCKK